MNIEDWEIVTYDIFKYIFNNLYIEDIYTF